MPSKYHYFANAVEIAPDIWRYHGKLKKDMRIEGHTEKHIDNVIRMIKSRTYFVDQYLAGKIRKADEAQEMVAQDTQSDEARQREDNMELHSKQMQLEDEINSRVDIAMTANHPGHFSEGEGARQWAIEKKHTRNRGWWARHRQDYHREPLYSSCPRTWRQRVVCIANSTACSSYA